MFKKNRRDLLMFFLTLLNQTKNLKIVPLKGFKIVDLSEILKLVPYNSLRPTALQDCSWLSPGSALW